jgi:hypothetical protein
MRLLHFGKQDGLSFAEFSRGDVPPYAILSHTWSQGDSEVTYQDIKTGIGKTKPGYTKILGCGQQAAKYSLSYFWVDTCCIDKASGAELTEAINSMYRWYQDAKICFAYLEDISADKASSLSQLCNARWFSRGWTVQELIAPEKVELYASDWTPIGTKKDRCDEISSITGIHSEALQARPVVSFSIAQRMSWASKRTTTRPEDIAYSLLGLFNINMPIVYGEGAKKAFNRLQNEIIKDSDDQSLFAWTTPSVECTTLRGLLADSPADFASSGAIVPVRGGKINRFSSTNGRVRITLPMTFSRRNVLPLGDARIPFRTGVLDCVATDSNDKPQQLVALSFYCLTGDEDQYARADASRLKYVPTEMRGRCICETIHVPNHTTVKNAFEASQLEKSDLHDSSWLQQLRYLWQFNVIEDVEVRLLFHILCCND